MAWNQTPTLPPNQRHDGYVNMLNKIGTSQDSSTGYTFEGDSLASDFVLTNLYEFGGLFAKIIDTPAEEAVKNGIDIGLKGSEAEEFINGTLERLDWEEKAAEAIKWTRLYGGAIAVMVIDDGGDIDEPLNWNKIRAIDEIRVYERAVVWPDYNSLYKTDYGKTAGKGMSKFGMPEYYHVNSVYGQFWAHESRCLLFRNGKLPERTMNSQYRLWGMPEYSRICHELRETTTTHSLAVKLLERSVQAIYSMQGLARLLATEDGENEVVKRLQTIDMARNILNSIAIDSEGESYEFKATSLSGVKEVVDTTCNALSAVTNIPQTILFGRSPAGQNSTGESDFENYYNMVAKIQKLMLKGNTRTLVDIIVRAGLTQGKLTEEPATDIKFNPLWSMSEAELAEIDSKKATTQKTKAETAKIYTDIGSLDPSEIRRGLAEGGEFQVEEILDDTETDGLFGIESEDGQQMLAEFYEELKRELDEPEGVSPDE